MTLAQSKSGSENLAILDRIFRASIGKQCLGLSPPGLMLVYLDWLVRLREVEAALGEEMSVYGYEEDLE